MESATSGPRLLPFIPDPETDFCMPPRDGFAGLTATNRAARESILHRAYAIWESKGHPENCRLAHWLEAESEILRPT